MTFAFVAHELVRLAHLADPAAGLAGGLGDFDLANVARLRASRSGHQMAGRPFDVPEDVIQVQFESEVGPIADALVCEPCGA